MLARFSTWMALLALPAVSLGGCETLLAARARAEHPPHGELVDVGQGRRIQIDCRGHGAPTVVFQAGGDAMGSLGWEPALQLAAQTTRACAYSRAGIMWSDPSSGPFRPEEVAEDLHAALQNAGEIGPFVLVGHSRGGLYNLIYAGLYPDEIAGLVFADASHPDQEDRLADIGAPHGRYVGAWTEAALALRWTGLMRLAPYPVDAAIAGPVRAYYPKSAAADAREARARRATLAAAGRYRDLRNWPVVVLARETPEATQSRLDAEARNAWSKPEEARARMLPGPQYDPGVIQDAEEDDASGPRAAEIPPRRGSPTRGADQTDPETVWRSLQADLSTWSSRGRLEVVPNSDHAFFFFQPEAVADAIDDVVAATRAHYGRSRTPADSEDLIAPFADKIRR